MPNPRIMENYVPGIDDDPSSYLEEMAFHASSILPPISEPSSDEDTQPRQNNGNNGDIDVDTIAWSSSLPLVISTVRSQASLPNPYPSLPQSTTRIYPSARERSASAVATTRSAPRQDLIIAPTHSGNTNNNNNMDTPDVEVATMTSLSIDGPAYFRNDDPQHEDDDDHSREQTLQADEIFEHDMDDKPCHWMTCILVVAVILLILLAGLTAVVLYFAITEDQNS